MNIWQRQGHFHAAVARPKGRFETVRVSGRDNTQGPYRVTSGTAVAPVVPGSENVWLDGVKLERGGDKDYTIDYPTGAITFNVNHPIYARSRIEVDYEPLLTDYKGELLESGGIFVRYFDTPQLKDMIRVSVGKPEHTDTLIAALSRIGGKGNG